LGKSKLEEKILGELSVDKAFNHIRWFAENVPHRLSGEPRYEKAVEYVQRVLGNYGIPVDVHRFNALVSFPQRGELRVRFPEKRAIECVPFAHSASTGENGITGELVYVGSGGYEGYRNINVAGKIVLAELSYSPPRPEKLRIAQEQGARGLVVMNWGLPESTILPWGTVKPVWGNPTPERMKEMPEIPAVGITRKDGEHLKALLQKKPINILLKVEVLTEWRKIKQPVAYINCGNPTHEFILLGGHLDAWGRGVTCNATGNSMMIELARVLNNNRKNLKRNIRIGFWAAHENGIMAGSSWYLDNFWDDIEENCIAYINCDTPGMKDASRYFSKNTEEIADFHERVARDVLGNEVEIVSSKRQTKTGDQTFLIAGIPSMAGRMLHSEEQIKKWNGATLGWWYHSDEDTMDKASRENFGRTLKVTASMVVRLCSLPVLPLNFEKTIQVLERRINELHSLNVLKTNIENISRKTQLLKKRIKDLNRFIGELNFKEIDQEKACKVNRTLKKLGQLLTPINYTVAGRYDHDTYGLSCLNKPLPALYEIEKLAELKKGSHEFNLLETKLLRAVNKVSDILKQSMHTIDVVIE